jgi:hypothetical protein
MRGCETIPGSDGPMFSGVACVSSSITATASDSSAPTPALGGTGKGKEPTLNPGDSRFGREALREPDLRDAHGTTAVRAAQGQNPTGRHRHGHEVESGPRFDETGNQRQDPAPYNRRSRRLETNTDPLYRPPPPPTRLHASMHACIHAMHACLGSAYLKPRLVRLPVAWSRNGNHATLEYSSIVVAPVWDWLPLQSSSVDSAYTRRTLGAVRSLCT